MSVDQNKVRYRNQGLSHGKDSSTPVIRSNPLAGFQVKHRPKKDLASTLTLPGT